MLQFTAIRFPEPLLNSNANSPVSYRKTPRQERARGTVSAILQAAAQVLVAEGYARLTTTRVADRAGVSVGTLYQYFGNKDALVRAVKARHTEAIMDKVRRAVAASAGQNLEARVRSMLEALLAAKAAEGELCAVVMMTMLELDGRVAIEHGMAESKALVRGLLEAHQAELQLADADVDLATRTLVHAVDGVVTAMILHHDPTRPVGDPRHVDELVRLVLGYLTRA